MLRPALGALAEWREGVLCVVEATASPPGAGETKIDGMLEGVTDAPAAVDRGVLGCRVEPGAGLCCRRLEVDCSRREIAIDDEVDGSSDPGLSLFQFPIMLDSEALLFWRMIVASSAKPSCDRWRSGWEVKDELSALSGELCGDSLSA